MRRSPGALGTSARAARHGTSVASTGCHALTEAIAHGRREIRGRDDKLHQFGCEAWRELLRALGKILNIETFRRLVSRFEHLTSAGWRQPLEDFCHLRAVQSEVMLFEMRAVIHQPLHFR